MFPDRNTSKAVTVRDCFFAFLCGKLRWCAQSHARFKAVKNPIIESRKGKKYPKEHKETVQVERY